MKRVKFAKFALVFVTMVIMVLSTTCKKAEDENAKDITVITNIAAMSMTDLNSISFSAGGSMQSGAGDCSPYTKHVNINFAPSFIANPFAGHGWYTGYLDTSINKNCDVSVSILSNFNCVLGAVTTSGDKLGGTLYINGTVKLINNSLDMSIREYNGTTGFEVNGRTHTIDLTCAAHGTPSGGTITISGRIDGDTINYSTNY